MSKPCGVGRVSDLDKAIRAELARDYWRLSRHSSTAADKGASAVLALLDWATALETDGMTRSEPLVTALTRQVREVLADSLGVSGEDRSEPTPAPGGERDV